MINSGYIQVVVWIILIIAVCSFLEIGTRIFSHLLELIQYKKFRRTIARIVSYDTGFGAYGVNRYIPVIDLEGSTYKLSQYRLLQPELVNLEVEVFQSDIDPNKIICLKFNIWGWSKV